MALCVPPRRSRLANSWQICLYRQAFIDTSAYADERSKQPAHAVVPMLTVHLHGHLERWRWGTVCDDCKDGHASLQKSPSLFTVFSECALCMGPRRHPCWDSATEVKGILNPPTYVLDMGWHASEPDPSASTGEAARHARALLAGMEAGSSLQRLALGAGNAFAVVSELPQVRSHGDAGINQPCRARQSKLYVLRPGCELASMLLPEHFGACGALDFSPSGRHLLVGCGCQGMDLHLVTSSCRNLVSFPHSTAAFSPDGALVAVVGAAIGSATELSLVRCADGQQIFSMVCSNLPGQHLCFNALGNQLTLSSRIICFGLDDDNTAKGRQLCRAISASSSWASSKLQDGVV